MGRYTAASPKLAEMLRGAFRPATGVCALRALSRQRAMLLRSQSRHVQHMQKALAQMNMQLANVISDVVGETGQKILRAIVAGERDGRALAQMKNARIHASAEEIAKSLQGSWRAEHLFALKQALVVVSEVGADLSRFPSDKHFASWLGLCPGTKITGGKLMSGKTKRCANRAAQALRLAAAALRSSQSALGAYFRRLCSRMDKPKAVTAAAHKLARLTYAMLTKGEEYTDQAPPRVRVAVFSFRLPCFGCCSLLGSFVARSRMAPSEPIYVNGSAAGSNKIVVNPASGGDPGVHRDRLLRGAWLGRHECMPALGFVRQLGGLVP